MKQKEEIICCRKFMKNIRNVSTGARESMRMWVLSKLIMKILIARAFKRKNGKALNLDIKTGSNIIYVLNQYKKSRKMFQNASKVLLSRHFGVR